MIQAGLRILLHHEPGIREALERCGDPATPEDVFRAILDGRAQVWGDERALIVTEIVTPHIHFWIATGEIRPVIELSDRVVAWAREQGLTRATLTGRRGWVRALAQEGWREQAVLMEKVIDNG